MPIRLVVADIRATAKAVRQAVKLAGDEAIRLPLPPFIEDHALLAP